MSKHGPLPAIVAYSFFTIVGVVECAKSMQATVPEPRTAVRASAVSQGIWGRTSYTLANPAQGSPHGGGAWADHREDFLVITEGSDDVARKHPYNTNRGRFGRRKCSQDKATLIDTCCACGRYHDTLQ